MQYRHSYLIGLWLALLPMLCPTSARGQYVMSENEPPGVRWSQIRTPHFTVIFPDSVAHLGEHYTRLLLRVYQPVHRSLGPSPRHIPVLLHPYNLQSNGMVVWAPKRMEIMSTAPSDMYGQPWLTQLALHEFRHVVQTDMLNRGFTRGLYFVLGEQAVGLVAGTLPPWLFEGDAVATETALSYTGRGRMPSFEMGLRTIQQSQMGFGYSKLLLGSYRDYIPNHYEYGYHMVAYGRLRYGAPLWGKVYSFAANYPFTVFTHNWATLIYTGRSPRRFHAEAMQYLDTLWRNAHVGAYAPVDTFSQERRWQRRQFVSYTYPVWTQGQLLAQKTSLFEPPQLVQFTPQGQHRHRQWLGGVSSRLMAAGHQVYWTEIRPSLRWGQVNYSELWCHNLLTGSKRQLTRRTSYFSPAPSAAGQLAVVQKHPNGTQEVLLLDSATYQPTRHLVQYGMHEAVNELAWAGERRLAMITVTPQGTSLGYLHMPEGNYVPLLQGLHIELSQLWGNDTLLLFNAGRTTISNLYALDLRNGRTYQLTDVPYGAYGPQMDGQGNIYFANYSPQGYKIARADSTQQLCLPADLTPSPYFALANALAAQEQFNIDTATLNTQALEVTRYRKLTHAMRIHSWSPFFFTASTSPVGTLNSTTVGVTLLSQNTLGTLYTQLGYLYDQERHQANASITYTGWYPAIVLDAAVGARNQWYIDIHNREPSYQGRLRYTSLSSVVYVPLNLSRAQWISSLVPSLALLLTNDHLRLQERFEPEFSTRIALSYSISQRMALRDIYPRLGLSTQIGLRSAPLLGLPMQQWSLWLNTYLPGLWRNHSLRLWGGYEWQDQLGLYAHTLSMPRGLLQYSNFFSNQPHNRTPQVVAGRVNYTLPLLYPDLSLGFPAYIKRIRLNGFVDYAGFRFPQGQQYAIYSMGYELTLDFHLFRLPYEFSAGWRQSFTHDHRGAAGRFTEALFSVQF